MNKIFRFFIMVALLLFSVMAFARPVYAEECDHNWVFQYEDTDDYSDTQHKIVETYRCLKCNDTKEEITYVDHEWVDSGYGYNYHNVSDTQHSYKQDMYCSECYREKVIDITEDHSWDHYDEAEKYSDTQHKIVTYYECYECDAEKEEVSYADHSWVYQYDEAEDYSATQHKIIKYYECYECEDEKEEISYADHSWVNYGSGYDYNKISNTQHSYIQDMSCSDCDRVKEVRKKGNHSYDKFHVCKKCYEPIAKNITLAANKTAYVNEKSWIKITIPAKGYIQVTTKGRSSGWNPSWSLYNSKKAVFIDSQYSESKTCVPVKKGTYYIKVAGDSSIKYTFKKDPSKKNYTKSTAIKLPKTKKLITVIYPSDKKNTWNRVYKITLSKSQKVRLYLTNPGSSSIDWCYLFDSKGNYLDTDFEYTKSGQTRNQISTKKLKKGTYYIVVSNSWGSSKNRNAGSVYSVSWK